MTGAGARAGTINPDGGRLARPDRRDTLLDAAAELIETMSLEDVSMESVAERAGVSRPLVYKHFANRQDLLSSLYERESAQVHARVAADVRVARNMADMLGALVRGMLGEQASRGWTLAPSIVPRKSSTYSIRR